MSKTAHLRIDENIATYNKNEDASILDLSNCGLKSIPKKLLQCIWIKKLDLGNYKIKSEENQIANPVNFGTNSFTEDSLKGLKALSNLKELSVASCQIKNLSFISKLSNLEGLDISHNEIEDLSILKKINSLTKLIASYSKVKSLNGLEELVSLEELYLDGNLIENIDPLNRLKKLIKIDLSFNSITSINALEGCSSLKHIDLGSNNISKIVPIATLKYLETLDLRWNKIDDLASIDGSQSIKSLSIVEQEVDIINFPNIPNLKSLMLALCYISDISFLSKFQNLEELNLSGNNIIDISVLSQLKKIKYVDLRVNKISNINGIYMKGIALENYIWKEEVDSKIGLNLYENPLDDILISILQLEDPKRKRKELNYYFERSKKGTSQISKTKIIFLGNTGAGKTTLSDLLTGKKKSSDGSTHGINIFNYKYKNNEVLGFDFGGQEYYHNTHFAFFERNVLYFIIWGNGQINQLSDSINNDILYPLDYWLGSINYFNHKKFQSKEIDSKNKHVYILQNLKKNEAEIDTLTELNNLDLKIKFPFINEFYSGSIVDSNDSIKIKKWFESKISQFAHTQTVNRLDLQVAKDLKLNKGIVLGLTEFQQLNQSMSNFDEYEIIGLIKALHYNLACFYISKEELSLNTEVKKNMPEKYFNILPQCIIIDLEKFTKWLHEILNIEKLKNIQNGYFSINDATNWLKENKAKENINYIIAFMLYNKIIFPVLEKEDHFIAPQYLNKNLTVPEKLFIKNFEAPTVKYQFNEFYHSNIFVEILIKFHQFLLKNENQANWEYVLWKNKVLLFEAEESIEKLLLIKMEIENKLPTIQISRNHKNKVSDDFLKKVMEFIEVEITNYSYKKLILTPSQIYIPFDCLSQNNKGLDGTNNNLIFHDSVLYRKSDFNLFTNQKYPMKKIFVSYSKHDENYLQDFQDHLVTLIDEGLVNTFDCRAIDFGNDWDDRIKKEIDDCDIMVCLVSVKFLNTEYIKKIEIPRAIEKGKLIIPIIIKACDWESSILGKYQSPQRGKIVSINNKLQLTGEIQAYSEEERAVFWYKIIKEFRTKILS